MGTIYKDSPWVRRACWLALPVLAVLAYLNVLRVGFLSDDFVLLTKAADAGTPFYAFARDSTGSFYRPIGEALSWWLNWNPWGYNPLAL